METVTAPAQKKTKTKFIIIILLVLVLTLLSIIGYFAVSGLQFSDLMKIFESNKEYSILLNEFIVNLKSENANKNYLKVQIALMYTEEKHGQIINTNVNKVRDTILNDLRKKTSQEILNGDNIHNVKNEIMNNVNSVLEADIVKDVYFTDLVVQ